MRLWINYVIKENCLNTDLFNCDETFKFQNTYWANGLYFIFKNNDDEETEFRMSADFICIP